MTSIYDYNATPTSNTGSPPAGFGTGQAPSQVRVMLQDIVGEVTEFVHSAVAGGTADALTVTLTNIPASLTDGMEIHVRAAAANATTTPTLNLNALGAKTITKRGGTALVAGDIAGNLAEHTFRYNLANTRWELLNPAKSDLGNTTGTLAVASGGTGLTSGTSGGVLAFTASGTLASSGALTANAPMVGGGAGVAPTTGLSVLTNSLGADVALSNTALYFDGPSVAQGSVGTWLAVGSVTVVDTGTTGAIDLKLWDGTNVADSGIAVVTVANNAVRATLAGIFTSPPGNIRISAKDPNATTGGIKFNSSGNSKDSTLTVVRIG